jgi:hypothetical protein
MLLNSVKVNLREPPARPRIVKETPLRGTALSPREQIGHFVDRINNELNFNGGGQGSSY